MLGELCSVNISNFSEDSEQNITIWNASSAVNYGPGSTENVMDCFQGRISQDYEHFLIAPFGMLHHEVTASSLVKVDMRGDVLDVGASGIGLGVNKLGFSLHGAVYASRPDIKCIIHLRCPSAVAVGFQRIVVF